MKKFLYYISILILFLSFNGLSHAGLSVSNGMVYDDATNLYWYADLNYFENKTYAEQITAAEALTTGGLEWHMATENEIKSLFENYSYSEIGAVFSPNLSDLSRQAQYSGVVCTIIQNLRAQRSTPLRFLSQRGHACVRTPNSRGATCSGRLLSVNSWGWII